VANTLAYYDSGKITAVIWNKEIYKIGPKGVNEEVDGHFSGDFDK
jgi:hypothetical protein